MSWQEVSQMTALKLGWFAWNGEVFAGLEGLKLMLQSGSGARWSGQSTGHGEKTGLGSCCGEYLST